MYCKHGSPHVQTRIQRYGAGMFQGGSAVSSVSRPFFFPPALPLWNSRPHHTIGSSWDRNIKEGRQGVSVEWIKRHKRSYTFFCPHVPLLWVGTFFPKAKIETLVVNLVNMEAPPASVGISASVAVSWKSSSWLEVNCFQDNCAGTPVRPLSLSVILKLRCCLCFPLLSCVPAAVCVAEICFAPDDFHLCSDC